MIKKETIIYYTVTVFKYHSRRDNVGDHVWGYRDILYTNIIYTVTKFIRNKIYTNIIYTETKLIHDYHWGFFCLPFSIIHLKSLKIVYVSTCKWIFTMYTPDICLLHLSPYTYPPVHGYPPCICSYLTYPKECIHVIINKHWHTVYDLIVWITYF